MYDDHVAIVGSITAERDAARASEQANELIANDRLALLNEARERIAQLEKERDRLKSLLQSCYDSYVENTTEELAQQIASAIAQPGTKEKAKAKDCHGCERTRGWVKLQSLGTVGTCPICKAQYYADRVGVTMEATRKP
jgi:recombinational DNA repair ATPase RecF